MNENFLHAKHLHHGLRLLTGGFGCAGPPGMEPMGSETQIVDISCTCALSLSSLCISNTVAYKNTLAYCGVEFGLWGVQAGSP